MSPIILALVITGGATVQDGSLLFLENSNAIVERYTDSKISHVGVVINVEGRPWVYEATPPAVRRVTLSDYVNEIAELNESRKTKMRIWIRQPTKSFSGTQTDQMRQYLDEQLGRRYSIKNYVRKKQGDGVHCAELAANTLERSGSFDFEGFLENPDTLLDKISAAYSRNMEVTVKEPADRGSWCSRTWSCWKGFFRWCGWSCYETWTFCR